MKDSGINFSRKHSHDGQGRHIQGDASARLELVVTQPRSTPYDIPRTRTGLYNEAFTIQALQYVTNNLSNTLQRAQIILCFLIASRKPLDVFTKPLQTSLHFSMLTDLGAILIQDLLTFGTNRRSWLGRCGGFIAFVVVVALVVIVVVGVTLIISFVHRVVTLICIVVHRLFVTHAVKSHPQILCCLCAS